MMPDLPPVDQGWTEVIVSVADLPSRLAALTAATGWEVVHRGPLPPAVRAAWGLPPGAGEEALLGEPGATRGHMRLVALGETTRRRSSAQPWEAGGWTGVNLRVADIELAFRRLQLAGFQGFSDPVTFDVQGFRVREAMMAGPDGLVLGLIERVSPPLAGFGLGDGLSRPVTLIATVASQERAGGFVQSRLGWQRGLAFEGPIAAPGMNLFGLPHDLVADRSRAVGWWHPGAGEEGRIATLSFTGLKGRDFGADSWPGLGLMLARVPVSDIARACARVAAPLVHTLVAPWGAASACRTVTPDGGAIELFALHREPRP